MSGHDPRLDYDDEVSQAPGLPNRFVKWTAMALIAAALMQLGISLIAAGFWLLPLLEKVFRQEGLNWKDIGENLGIVAVTVVGIITNSVALLGSLQMWRLRHPRLAVTAAALVGIAIPFFPLSVLTMPLAVWAIRLLWSPDVRARFEAVTRSTIPPSPHKDTTTQDERT